MGMTDNHNYYAETSQIEYWPSHNLNLLNVPWKYDEIVFKWLVAAAMSLKI